MCFATNPETTSQEGDAGTTTIDTMIDTTTVTSESTEQDATTTTTTPPLTKTQLKALKKLKRKEDNIKRIKEANATRIREECENYVEINTPPERKPAITVSDNMKPVFGVGEYVKVKGDSSPGNNHPDGFGFVVKTAGVGAAAKYTVKYTKSHDNARTHGNIGLEFITRVNFGEEFCIETRSLHRASKRQKVSVEAWTPPVTKKWFWGLVMRRDARCCEELEISQQAFKAYHRNHINKCMGVAFTALAFEDSLENGGEAVKLGFFRAQSYKVAEKMVRESVRQADGRMRQTGPIKRKRDDLYLVDCAVTGSNEGTSDSPKFALSRLFENHVFPKVLELVKPGGKYEGYTPIFQGDSAGPHVEAAYMQFVKGYCQTKGWHWEPQAPQMPHMNVLDLAVFPCMSRRHTALARERGGMKVLSEDEIWAAAKEVWEALPNSKIASAYVLSYRIAAEVIKAKGDNAFLGDRGVPHVGVRADFNETALGLERKDGKHVPPPSNN